MTDAAARYQSLDGEARVVQNLVYNPSSGNWELEQQSVIEAVTGNLYLAVDELESIGDSAVAHLTTISGAVSGTEMQVDLVQTGSIQGASTTTPLDSAATYTSSNIDMTGFAGATVIVYTDKAGSLSLEVSSDGSNWITHVHTVAASEPHVTFIPTMAQYFRVVYTNGGTAQTSFQLHVWKHPVPPVPYSHSIQAELDDDDIALITRSVITGETTAGGGGFVNVKVNPSGTLEVSDGDAQDAVADVQTAIDDQLLDYKFSGWTVSGTAVYCGYEDKSGNYFVRYLETSTGVVTYAVGTGGIVAPGSYSGLSYGSFASKF